ncbi:hypothetical protein DNTS_029927 [Danionella cerebrum]|uniref:Pentraxin (PTX) domain-containing protein n=1 Tax=Danionella cerebrum TaxID=2873325 RepID=A0A553RPY4_9TELE|nr:hypothetical protein DNTS_029927 [Danionella translucida]
MGSRIRMNVPGAILALCLPCFLTGSLFAYEYAEDYPDSYYNDIPNAEGTQTPCLAQDLSRWDKLFIFLEDSQMKQNMLLQQTEDMAKSQLDSIRKELQKLNSSKDCIQAAENTCRCISEQIKRSVKHVMEQLREAAEAHQAQANETLQQLIQLSRSQAARLSKLESTSVLALGLGQVAVKSFSGSPKEQEASHEDGGKLERALMITSADLQMVHSQLEVFQRATTSRFLPSGCEMALLFPMRSKHTFAEVTPSMSMSVQSFTICLWAKVTQSLNKTILFSYGTKKNPQELQLYLASGSVVLMVGGETHLVEASGLVTDGQWGHVCASWSLEQGLATLWIDGENIASVSGVAKGHIIPDEGFILLGQEQRHSGGHRDFDPKVAFTGKMTAVNLWDYVLKPDRIRTFANPDGSCDSRGNVIGWGISEIIPHGGVLFIRMAYSTNYSRRGGKMGKGICSSRQRKIFHSFLLILFVCGTLCALMISYEMHKELKRTEATAMKYQQHQESLSAQLQVVYEHHSKLEKSLQKERLEHKKADEDFLVFKRESQKALNKEKHEDLKMQYYELQEKHLNQGQDHERVVDEHRLEMDNLQREKEVEISRLKENVYNLREENRQLRKAHQDIYTQLLDMKVEGYDRNGKGFSPRGVLEIGNNNVTKVPMKQPLQIVNFAEGGNGENVERITSKDRRGEDKVGKPVLEHFPSKIEEAAINPRNTLSQSQKQQTPTLLLHIMKGDSGALHAVNVGKEGDIVASF